MKCPKCGFNNIENAHFCCECGADLSSEKYLCPNCRKQVSKDSKHCINCGKELNWVNVDYNSIPIPISHSSEKKVKTLSPNSKISKSEPRFLRYLLPSILFVAMILLLVGCFGALIKGYVDYDSQSYRDFVSAPSYYFDDIFNSIKTLKESDPYGYYYNFELFLMVVDLIVYYSLIILAFTFITLSSINLIKYMLKKDDNINTSFLTVLILPAILHIMFVKLRFCVAAYTVDYTAIKLSFGWGTSLVLVATIIILAFIIFNRIFGDIQKRKPAKIVGTSLSTFGDLLSFILLMIVFGCLFTVRDGTERASFNATYTIRYLLLYNPTTKDYITMQLALNRSTVAFVLLFAFVNRFLVNFIININNSSLVKLILGAVGAIGIIVSEFILLSASKLAFSYTVSLGVGGVFIILISLFVIALHTSAFVLKKKE